MADTNINTYSQKEIALDAVTLTGATAAATLASKVHLVDPLSIGTLVLAGANILALAATKKLLDHQQIESKFLRTCAIITALALTTLAIPFAIGTLCGSSIAILSLEVALQTTLLHLATKVATYGLFRGGLLFRDFFFLSFPSSIREITAMPQSQLQQVKTHLLDFPRKTKQIPLLFQFTLNQQLKENGLTPLPLKNFSDKGKDWTWNQLKQLHAEDFRNLPLEKKAAVAELFLYHNFPPQDRPYVKDELPEIDYGAFGKKLSTSQLLWAHLITRLNPKAPLYDPIVKQFYHLHLSPPRDDAWIDLPLPSSKSRVQHLKPYQIQWYANLFQAQPQKWENLPIPIQQAFNLRFETKRTISRTAPKEVPSLLGRVTKEITWKRVAIASAVVATALVTTYYFRPDLFPNIGWKKTVDLATNNPPAPPPALPTPSLTKAPLEPPPMVSAKNLTSPEQPFCLPQDAHPPEPCFPPVPAPIPPAVNVMQPTSPVAFAENLPPPGQFFCPLKNTTIPTLSKTNELGQNLLQPGGTRPELPPQLRLSSRITDFAHSQLNHFGWKLALPGLLTVPLLMSFRACKRQERPVAPPGDGVPPPAFPISPGASPDDDAPGALVVGDESKKVAAKRANILAIEIPREGRYAFDLSNPVIRRLVNKYLRIAEDHPSLTGTIPMRIALGGKIYPSNSPLATLVATAVRRGFIAEARRRLEIPRLPPDALEEEKETKQLDWSAIEQYVSKHCPGVSFAKAKEMIREGIPLIQQLRKNEKVEPTHLDHKLAAVCWGLMAHNITKRRPFNEGTTDISDPGNRIFNFFLPTLYGRASSHYKQRTIAFEDGPWCGYGHFGLDVGELPAGKRTVMMGRLKTRDGSHRTYLKMENNGANLNFRTDPRALANLPQVLAHTLEYFESQAKRKFPSIFGEVGGGLHMHKEHMLREDKEKITSLIRRAKEVDSSIEAPKDLDEYGFQDAVPCLKRLCTNPKLSPELRAEIEAYVNHLHDRYDGLPYRKGDEASMSESIMDYGSSLGASDLSIPEVDGDLEGFEELEPSEGEKISEWNIAYNRLLSTDVLSNHSVIVFGDLLEKEQKCTFVPDLLIPGIAENQRPLEPYLKGLFENAIARARKCKGPIFIPLILKNPSKRIPFIGSYFKDHIVVLTYENGKWEYYDSKGGKFEIEERNILGLNMKPRELLNHFQKEEAAVASNSTAQLKVWDWVNCGPFACNYMWQRTDKSLEEISEMPEIDSAEMRRELAAHLKRRHAPPSIDKASCPADITARLDAELARCYRKKATKLLKENASPYLKDDKSIDKDRIFAQINLDLSRHGEGMNQFTLNGVVYDGTPGKNDANALLQELLKTGRKEEEILTLMTLLQQGIFGSIEMAIWKDLDILDADSGMQIRGQGEYLAKRYKPFRTYNIRTKGRNIILECSSYYEVVANALKPTLSRLEPYGILEASVQLDLYSGKASESWRVKETITI